MLLDTRQCHFLNSNNIIIFKISEFVKKGFLNLLKKD